MTLTTRHCPLPRICFAAAGNGRGRPDPQHGLRRGGGQDREGHPPRAADVPLLRHHDQEGAVPTTGAGRIGRPARGTGWLAGLTGAGQGRGVRVGVVRNHGKESGVGIGVDQTASIPTPDRFV